MTPYHRPNLSFQPGPPSPSAGTAYRNPPMPPPSPVPAEWELHSAMWVGFPSHESLWEENLSAAQGEVAALARALAGPGREQVKLMVAGEAAGRTAEDLLSGCPNIEVVNGDF